MYAPTLNGIHVLRGNTAYHNKYEKSGNKQQNNALEKLHSYVGDNFNLAGLDTKALAQTKEEEWSKIKEEFDVEGGGDEETGPKSAFLDFSLMRSAKDFAEKLAEALKRLVREPLAHKTADATEDAAEDALISSMSALSLAEIKDPRMKIKQLFREHAGGELKTVALGLKIDIPSTEREWMDDPMADESHMVAILQHPSIQALLKKHEIADAPELQIE
ncbi:hypothetical protein T484DRAFT_1766624 [Baffinella frigidus]|nr:hypothetical protein T484DRAFT_1766624 [Cryptophyta sp. CCMP2293]